jgi:uncharacterized protein YbaP (TraB family)
VIAAHLFFGHAEGRRDFMRIAQSSSIIAICLCLSGPVVASPAMWEVSDENSSIFLFGSFHVLPAGADWRTPLFDEILGDADKVVFETDIGPAAQAEIGAKAIVRGTYIDGTLLTDVIEPALEDRLRDEAGLIGLQVGTIIAMKPWLAANTISVTALAAEGYGLEGVEMLLDREIAAERMAFLETGDEQLDVLAGAPDDEQIAMLAATLDQLSTLPKIMDKMVHHWLEGTPDQLAGLFLTEMGGFEAAFMDRLIYDRNANWVAPLEGMLADDEQALVIVGAAHLIGDGSVVDLLETAGYRVERVQ